MYWNPLHVERTDEWDLDGDVDRRLKDLGRTERVYGRMHYSLGRRAHSIPPSKREDPVPRAVTPSEGEDKALEQDPLPAAPTTSDVKEGDPEVHREQPTAEVEPPECASQANDSSSPPHPAEETSMTRSSSLHSSVKSLFSQPPEWNSQTTVATTQPWPLSPENSSQDPWLAYGHSQRASQDPYEDQDTSTPRREWIPESQPNMGSAEEISLSQLLDSSQPQEDDPLQDDAGGSGEHVEPRPTVAARPVQRIVDATLGTFRACLTQAGLAMDTYDETELRDLLASITRGAKATDSPAPKDPKDSEHPVEEPTRKRRRDDDSDSEESSAQTTKRQRL